MNSEVDGGRAEPGPPHHPRAFSLFRSLVSLYHAYGFTIGFLMRQDGNRNLLGPRLEALREHHCVTWGELAKILDISRSMLDFVRGGEREPGPKVLRKIVAAEITAGLASPHRIEASPRSVEPLRDGLDHGPVGAADLGERIGNASLERKIDELTRMVEALQKDLSELRARRSR